MNLYQTVLDVKPVYVSDRDFSLTNVRYHCIVLMFRQHCTMSLFNKPNNNKK